MTTSPKAPKKVAKPKAVAAPKVRKQKPASGSARRPKAGDAAVPAPRADATGTGAEVLDRLWAVVQDRRDADPASSHSARLLGRGTAKVAQKFGEEAVECLIEAVAGNRGALVAESADVLYHLLVLWVDAGVRPDEVWGELVRREGVSGIAEKAARPRIETRKIP
ncbi:MAG: phosphoribosyl-ATP diphosphatase [Janthinobacterium lividum]